MSRDKTLLLLLAILIVYVWQWSVRRKVEVLNVDQNRVPTPAATDKQRPQDQKSTLGPAALIFPVAGKSRADIISYFGDERGGGKRFHKGIDIKAPAGTPVIAATDGKIESVKEGGNGGKQILLKTKTGMTLFYAHLSSQWVKEGQQVKAGQEIGAVGNTGNARHTIPHLHFELFRHRSFPLDPLPYLLHSLP